MLEQLLDWDVTLFLYLNGLGTSFFDPFWMFVTHKATNFAVRDSTGRFLPVMSQKRHIATVVLV